MCRNKYGCKNHLQVLKIFNLVSSYLFAYFPFSFTFLHKIMLTLVNMEGRMYLVYLYALKQNQEFYGKKRKKVS